MNAERASELLEQANIMVKEAYPPVPIEVFLKILMSDEEIEEALRVGTNSQTCTIENGLRLIVSANSE